LSIFIEKDGKKILPRSIYIKILVFAGLICISAVLMQPVQSAINRLMLHIRTNFLESVERQIGMEIRYSSIRPTIFGSFDIRNLRLIKNEGVFLSVNRIRLFFSIPELIFKKKFAVNTIQIDHPVLRVNFEKDKDTIDLLSSMITNSEEKDVEFFQGISEFLPKEADYKIQNLSIYLSGDKTALNVQYMDVDFSWNGERIIIGGKFYCEAEYSGFLERTFAVKTSVSINCAYSPDLPGGNANISLLTFSFLEQDIKKREASFLLPASNTGTNTFFTLHPLSIAVSFDENSIHITPPVGDSLSYGFNYDFLSGVIDAHADFDRFVLNDNAYFYNNLEKFSHILNMPVSGSASFKYEPEKDMEYAVNISGGDFFRIARAETAVLTDSFVIRASGSQERVIINDFSVSASSLTAKTGLFQGILSYKGRIGFDPLLPNGEFSVSRFSLSGKEDINAVFDITADAREIIVSSGNVKAGKVSFLDTDLRMYLQDSYISITAAINNENEGTVYLDAVLDRNPLQLEATLSVASFPVMDLAEVFSPFSDSFNIPPFSSVLVNDISLDTEIFFTTDFKNIVYNAPYTVINASNNINYFSLSGTDHYVTINEGVFNINDNEFLASAQFNFSNPAELVFLFDANYLDSSWHIDGRLLDRKTLIIRDNNGLNLYGVISNTGSASGYIECVDYPFLFNGKQSYLDMYLSLRYDSFDFWYLDLAHLEIRDIQPFNSMDYMRISGVADQDGASFREILYSDAVGILAGSADFTWDSDLSYLQFMINLTDGYQKGEQYAVEGVLRNSHFDLSASVSNMHLDRFIKGSTEAFISADALVSWDSINSFEARIDLSSFYMMTQDNIITASGAALLTNDELSMHNVKFDFGEMESTITLLQLNREQGTVVTNANIQGFIDKSQKRLEGNADLYADFARIDSWLEINQALNSIDGTLRIADIKFGDMKQDEFVFDFSNNNGNVSFHGGERNMIRFDMDSYGNFFAGLSAPVPIQGTFYGVYKKGVVDAHCGSFFIDLSALWKLASGTEDFNIAGGYVTGKMDIRGPLFNPEFFGEGRGSSLRLKVPAYISEDIRPAPFDVVAEGYEFAFNSVPAIIGNGGGIVSGWMLFENWVPVNIGLEVDVPVQNPVPYSFNITGFLASGSVSGKMDLLIDAGNSLMEISGNLFTNDTEIGLNMDELASQSGNDDFSEIDFHSVVDLTVTAGSMVEFIWPNSNSPILRANPEMGTVIKVFSDTQTGQFSLNSNIKIRSGELYYFERSFYIREGSLVFKETENEFSPLISARAEIRDRTDSGPVTITMVIENEPLFSFEPKFETTPSLTQLEIYTILGQNINNTQGNDNTDMTQHFLLASTTDLLTQFVVSSEVFSQFIPLRQFERGIRNFLHLDMFSVRTRLLQNAVITGVTGLGQAPVDRNNSIGNYFDNTTVFIGKYIGQDMFIQGMLTMKYDENSTVLGGLVFEPDIGIELQSPYFNIRWDFFPNHPENFWVNDNSITLSWSKSF